MDPKIRCNLHCLQETNFKYKDTYRLKVKEWRKIYHANINQKKAGIAIFQTEQISEQRKLSGIKRGIRY